MCAIKQQPELQPVEDVHIENWIRNTIHAAVAPINDAYTAVKKYTAVRMASMASLMTSIEAYYTGHSCVLGDDMVYTPLAIFGGDGERFRIPLMDPLHEAVLTDRMSEPRTEALKKVLRKYGIGIMYFCCCGTILGPYDKIKEFYGSNEHLELERVRSFFDAQATSITMIDSIDELRERGIISPDFSYASDAEDQLFNRIEQLINTATQIPAPKPEIMPMSERLAAIAQRAQQNAQNQDKIAAAAA